MKTSRHLKYNEQQLKKLKESSQWPLSLGSWLQSPEMSLQIQMLIITYTHTKTYMKTTSATIKEPRQERTKNQLRI